MAEHLRIGHEDVDITAAAMAVAQHKHGAASESPEWFATAVLSDFIDQGQRKIEQGTPWPTWQAAGLCRIHD